MIMAIGTKVAGRIRYLVHAKSLRLESGRVLHENLLVPILCMGARHCMEGEGKI